MTEHDDKIIPLKRSMQRYDGEGYISDDEQRAFDRFASLLYREANGGRALADASPGIRESFGKEVIEHIYGMMSLSTNFSPIVCLDFDGVIHSYESRWAGATVIPDPPVEGAFDAIRVYMAEGLTVCVYSSRSSAPGGIISMASWMIEHGMSVEDVVNRIRWPRDKPPATLTIDDRAICFSGNFPTPEAIRAFRPWNKGGSFELSFDRYQAMAHETAVYPEERAVEYLIAGLSGEVGEFAGKVKKLMRGDELDPAELRGKTLLQIINMHPPERRAELIDELGDALWYMSELATALNISFGALADHNVTKLAGRALRGTLKGSGDDR